MQPTVGDRSPSIVPSSFSRVPRFLYLVVAACLITGQATGATRIWSGGHATSANWNQRDNWGGAGVPTHGDTVVFPSGAARLVNTNNLAGLRLHSIQFLGLGGGYNLRGLGLAISNGISIQADAVNSVSLAAITLHGPQALDVAAGGQLNLQSDLVLSNANLTLSGAGDLSLRCNLTGQGDLLKTGTGYVTLLGDKDNSYRGTTLVQAGTLALNQRETISIVPLTVVSHVAVPGNLVVGDGTNDVVVRLNYDEQIANSSKVTVLEKAQLRFFNFRDTIQDLILRGGEVNMESGIMVLNGEVTSLPSSLPASLQGRVNLNHPVTFTVGDGVAAVDLEVPATINDNGVQGLIKSGGGTLRLSGTNTYKGTTLIREGAIRVANDQALGGVTAGTTVLSGAGLQIDTIVETLREPLTMEGTGVGGNSGAIRIGSGATIATNIVLSGPTTIHTLLGGNLVVNGIVSGQGPLTKIGPGTLELAGAQPNTFLGNLFAESGTLRLSKQFVTAVVEDLVIGTTNSTATVRQTRSANLSRAVILHGGSLYDLADQNEAVDQLTFVGGGEISTGSGLLTVASNITVLAKSSPFAGNPIITGRLRPGASGTARVVVYPSGQNLPDTAPMFIHAEISGDAPIIKDGTGLLTLTASNRFSGNFTIREGTVAITDSHALGLADGDTLVEGSASLRLASSIHVEEERLFLNSIAGASTPLLPNAAVVSLDSNTWSGIIILGKTATVGVYSNSTLNVRGPINGFGGLSKLGPGQLIYSGVKPNTYAGITTIREGLLRLERSGGPDRAIVGPMVIGDGVGGLQADVVEVHNASQISDSAAVTLSDSGALRFLASDTIGSVAGAGRLGLLGGGTELTTGANDTSTLYSGNILGSGALKKTGTGTLILTGTNSYTGNTLIAGGTVIINGEQPDSDVIVNAGTTLRGTGRIGYLSVSGTFAPGSPLGKMTATGVNFTPGSTFVSDLAGAKDSIEISSFFASTALDVGGANLDLSLSFAPVQGQSFRIAGNGSENPTTGTFVGLPEGAILYRNQIPLRISYQDLSQENDITLTVGELPLRLSTTKVTGGNGNGMIDPEECNDLLVGIENVTGGEIEIVSTHLRSLNNRIIITHDSSSWGTIPAHGVRTNQTPFQIRTSSGFHCGDKVELELILETLGHGRFAVPIQIDTGKIGAVRTFASEVHSTPIPDTTIVSIPIEVTESFNVARIRVSLHVTHPAIGQLRIGLRSPNGYSIPLSQNHGGNGDSFGTSCDKPTRFDDNAPLSISAGSAPFSGLYRPDQSLSSFRGNASAGTWYLDIYDTTPGNQGELQCWSMDLWPYECDEGSGGCASCIASIAGELNDSSPTMPERLLRSLPPSGCGDIQPCAGGVTFGTPPYRYQVHYLTNDGPDTCVTIAINVPCSQPGNGLVASAYLDSFNPADLCASLLGGSGYDAVNGTGGFSFKVGAGKRFAVVVNEHNNPDPFSGCGTYSLEIFGLPCPQSRPTLFVATDVGPDNLRLHWSTAYPGFELQRRATLGGLGLSAFTNLQATPIVIDGQYSVTHPRAGKGNGFFRLHKEK